MQIADQRGQTVPWKSAIRNLQSELDSIGIDASGMVFANGSVSTEPFALARRQTGTGAAKLTASYTQAFCTQQRTEEAQAMNLLASALTPSFYAPLRRRRRRKCPKASVERLAALVRQGRDLWTGEPLDGKDLEDWLKMQGQVISNEAEIDDPAIQSCVPATRIPEAPEKGNGEKWPA